MGYERSHQFKILLSAEEKRWLDEIAEARGLSASDVVRLYVREAWAAINDPKTRRTA